MKHASSPAKMAVLVGALRLALVLAVLLPALMSVRAHATNAPIAWSAVAAETGAARDIVTTGSLVAALTFGTPGTVNSVSFGATSADITLSGESGLLSPVSPYAAYSFDPSLFTGWDPAYAALVSGAAYGHGSAMMLSLSGLSVGQSYLVQLLESPWDANWQTSFSDGANSSAALMVFGDLVAAPTISAVTDYVTGVFTATSGRQTIYSNGPYADTLLGAVQLRAIPQPVDEPPALALLGFGLAGLWYLRRQSG